MDNEREMMGALEALMFVWGRPLDLVSASEALDISPREARECMEKLIDRYDYLESGLMIRNVDGAFQFCTRPEYAEHITRFCTPVREKKLSGAALEVLAIVAYRQPVSRAVIDSIRGIKCDKVLEGLVNRGLVEMRGHGKGIGHPALYGTTTLFLEKLGLSSIKDLPDIGTEESGVESDSQQIAFDIMADEDSINEDGGAEETTGTDPERIS